MPVKKMSLVNLAVCEFVTDLLEEKVPSVEVLQAFKAAVDAEPTTENLSAYPSVIPTRLVKTVYPIYKSTPKTDEFKARIRETFERINTNVGAINVDFLMDYFAASMIHADISEIASVKTAAFEACFDHGPINNEFYEAELYSRLATLYLDDAIGNIVKIKELTPKLRAAVQKAQEIPSSFLG